MWNIIICVSRGGISMAEESKRFLGGDWVEENVQGKLISSVKKRVDGTWVPETDPRTALQWRHDERDGVSNHQPHDCLLNRLFRRRSKKTA